MLFRPGFDAAGQKPITNLGFPAQDRPDSAPVEIAAPPVTITAVPNRRRILVVEDEAAARAALFQLLTEAGYFVLTADDGQQALDLVMRGVRPRLMVVDLRLPNVSGAEFLHYIQTDADLRMIPRIVVTAMQGKPQVVADAVFHKPYEPLDLLEAIKRLAPPGTF